MPLLEYLRLTVSRRQLLRIELLFVLEPSECAAVYVIPFEERHSQLDAIHEWKVQSIRENGYVRKSWIR